MLRTIEIVLGSWGAQAARAEIVAGFDGRETDGRVYQANIRRARSIHGDLARLKQANMLDLRIGAVRLI